MTTPQAAEKYREEHMREFEGRKVVVYNPNGLDESSLPVIYGFNNGGSEYFYSAVAIAEDGTVLGKHCCSHEDYMPADLGVVEGGNSSRHEKDYQKHYPKGYRMEFVRYKDVSAHKGLQTALMLLEVNVKGRE